MPPKQKGGKEKKKKEPVPLDEIDTTVLNREELEEFCVKVYEELLKEKNYCEYLRIERDKLASMGAVSREHLSLLKAENRKKEFEIRDAEESHRKVMELNRRKLISLTSENGIDCNNLKRITLTHINEENARHENGTVAEVIRDVKLLKDKYIGLQNVFRENKIELDIKHAQNKCKIREEDKKMHLLQENKREKIIQIEIQRMEHRFLKEQNDLKSKKQNQICQYLKQNQEFTTDLNYYYNKIVHKNMLVLSAMKENIKILKISNASTERQYLQLKEENDELSKEYNRYKTEEYDLNKKLASSKRDQSELKETQSALAHQRELLESLKWENETLCMIQEEKEIEKKQAISKEQQFLFTMRTKVEEFNLILELIVTHLQQKNNELDSILNNLKEIFEMKRKRHELLTNIPDEYRNPDLDYANYRIANDEYERQQLIRRFKKVLKKHNIHFDNIGFKFPKVGDILKEAVPTFIDVIVDENTA